MSAAQRSASKEVLWKRQKGICVWCKQNMKKGGDSPNSATIEHMQPISHGGVNARYNLRLACKKCNHDRGNAWVEKSVDSRDLKSLSSNGVMVQVHPHAPTQLEDSLRISVQPTSMW